MTFFNPDDNPDVGEEREEPTILAKMTSRKLIAALGGMVAISTILIVIILHDSTLLTTAKPILERAFILIAALAGGSALLQYVIDRRES